MIDIDRLNDTFILSPLAFLTYWAGWFVVLPLGAYILYRLIKILKRNVDFGNWLLVFIQGVLAIGLIFVTCMLFVSVTNKGKDLDPNRQSDMEKTLEKIGE